MGLVCMLSLIIRTKLMQVGTECLDEWGCEFFFYFTFLDLQGLHRWWKGCGIWNKFASQESYGIFVLCPKSGKSDEIFKWRFISLKFSESKVSFRSTAENILPQNSSWSQIYHTFDQSPRTCLPWNNRSCPREDMEKSQNFVTQGLQEPWAKVKSQRPVNLWILRSG